MDYRIPKHSAGKTISLVSSCARIIRAHRISKPRAAPNQYEIAILAALDSDGTLTSKEIVLANNISKSSVSTALRSLKSKGWVATDGSIKNIELLKGAGFASGWEQTIEALVPLAFGLSTQSQLQQESLEWFLEFVRNELTEEPITSGRSSNRSIDHFLAATMIVRSCRSEHKLNTLSSTILENVWLYRSPTSEDLFQGDIMALGNQARIANELVRQELLKHNGVSGPKRRFSLSPAGERLFNVSPPDEMQHLQTVIERANDANKSRTDAALEALSGVSRNALDFSGRNSHSKHGLRRQMIEVNRPARPED